MLRKGLFSSFFSVFGSSAIIQEDTAPLFFTRVATTTALPPVTYAANVLTANANGALAAIDGISLSVGDYILVKNQAAKLQNGIYIVTALGSVGTPFVLTRATDYDATTEIYPSQVNVLEGTINNTTYWLQTTVNPVVGTNNIVFASKTAPLAGTGKLSYIDVHTETVLPNSPTYANGTSSLYPAMNATYTATTNGTFPVLQGIPAFNGMLILVKNQADQTKNGDYVIVNVGSATSKWKIRRVSYTSAGLYPRTWEVLQGTNQGILFLQTNKSLVNNTIGTSGNIVFTADAYYQQTLVSGTNIKTINSTSLLGSGNIDINTGGILTGTINHNAYADGNITYTINTPSIPKLVKVWTVSNTILDNTGSNYKVFSNPALGNLGSFDGSSVGNGFGDDKCTCYYYQEDVQLLVSGGGTRDYMPVLFENRFLLEIAFRDTGSADSGIYGNASNFQSTGFDLFIGCFGNKKPITTIFYQVYL